MDKTSLLKLTKALLEAEIWPHLIDSKESAARIFELQNDRGKSLKELEKLKASLMRIAYMEGGDNSKKAIDQIYKKFSKINLLLEQIGAEIDGFNEDSVISHFLIGYKNDLETDKDGHLFPEEYENNRHKYWQNIQPAIRYHFKNLKQKQKNVLQKVEELSEELLKAYQACYDILQERKINDDLACHFILSKKLSYFWPLFLKIQRLDGMEALKVVSKASAEFNIAFVHTPKRNTGESDLRSLAMDYKKGEAAQYAEKFRVHLKRKWPWNIYNHLQDALEDPWLYTWDSDSCRYILWRYENYLRRENGGGIPRIEWANFNPETTPGEKLTLDHIFPQNPKDNVEKSWLNEKIDEDKKGNPITNEHKYLHCLGNLALVRHSVNSKYGNEPALTKIADKKKKMGFREFISYEKLNEFVTDKKWQANAINKHQKALIEFVLKELFRA